MKDTGRGGILHVHCSFFTSDSLNVPIANIRLIDVLDNRGIEIFLERAETMHGRGSGRVIISSACVGLIFRRLRCYESGFERAFRGAVSGRIVRGTRHLAATRNFVLMRALGLK